jgi:UDP-4-amino-4,6-dideoxy-N-acetyl-beta-L-altrosamine N-acetyltransferase
MTYGIADFILRPVRTADSDVLLRWRNADHVRPFMYTDHLISQTEHRQWFSRMMTDEHKAYFILERDNRPLGLVCFTDIDATAESAVMGCYLGETDAPTGAGTVMGFLALDWIFHQRQVSQVHAEVLDFNEPSRRFFTRLGFEESGVLPGRFERRGRQMDVITFVLQRQDWLSTHRPRLHGQLDTGREK